jgi:hypothetical protein
MFKVLFLGSLFILSQSFLFSCISLDAVNKDQNIGKNDYTSANLCKLIEGNWQLHIAQRDNAIKLCDDYPCDGESFPTPVYFECKDEKVNGKLLEIVSKDKPIYSVLEVSLSDDEIVLESNNDNCKIKYNLRKFDEVFTGKYKAECKRQNVFPRKEGSVMMLRMK